MIPQAVAMSTAILAGNYVGSREPEEAKAVVNLGLMISFLYGTVAGAVLLFICRPVGVTCRFRFTLLNFLYCGILVLG
jgi:Na+-driven multidrug efflux pump